MRPRLVLVGYMSDAGDAAAVGLVVRWSMLEPTWLGHVAGDCAVVANVALWEVLESIWLGHVAYDKEATSCAESRARACI